MEKNNSVIIGLNSSSELLEVHYNWNIPKYKTGNIYSEKLKLKDDIECTLMLVPKIEDKGFVHRGHKHFVRSYVMVFFTKVPDDDNRQVFFNFNIRTHNKRRAISTVGFNQVMMKTEGYRGTKNNLNSAVFRYWLDKDFGIDLDVKFIIDDFSSKSFNLDNFATERSKLSQDYAALYKDPKFTDMMIICANDEKVPTNKALLASRSPVLAEILSNDIDTYIIGENIKKEIVTEFLRFVYADTISIDEFEANTIELLQIAKKYKVTELASLCEQDLMFGCKGKMDEICKQFQSLSCQDISELKNFDEICRCIKDLRKATKNIKLLE